MNSHTSPLLSIRDLHVSFRLDRNTFFEAVKGVSLDVHAGETLAIVGESGSGKSVSALAIMGLLPKESALLDPASRIEFLGRDLLRLPENERRIRRGRDIGMIFQDPMSSLNPLFSIGTQIAESLRLHKGMSRRAAMVRAVELLAEVGLPEPGKRAAAYPFQLSGGQQQRVMIAMAIACEPKLLIADEPTTALDVTIQKQIIELIDALRRKHGMAVMWISHDLAVVGEIADRVVVMRHGEVREMGTTQAIFTQPQDAYTRALLQCHPPLDHTPHRLAVIDDFMNGTPPATTPKVSSRETADVSPPLLRVDKLNKYFDFREGLFGKRRVHAVKDVSFTLSRGKTLGIVGESGCGKSTLALTLMRLHTADSGTIHLGDNDLQQMHRRSRPEQMAARRQLQIIFQNPYASLNPRFVVRDILLEPMRIHRLGKDDAERQRQAIALLDQVGLPVSSLSKYPHEFSGGQRQRIAIARALSLKPEILICDESVSALDVSVQAQVLNLLKDLQDELGVTYLFISHDLSVVKYMADDVMVMYQGEVVEMATAESLYHSAKHPYTEQLLGAIPQGYRPRTPHS